MPQMAPINWLTLYILFLLIYMMFIIMNFYSFTYLPKSMKINKKNLNIHWKW